MIRIALIAFSMLLTGCGHIHAKMYPGSMLPREKIATVTAVRGSGVHVKSVDGKFTVDLATTFINGNRYASSVDVLPGKHTLSLKYSNRHSISFADLWFVAEAGQEYSVMSLLDGYGVRLWIEEKGTRRKVGGVVGSVDEPWN